MVKKTVVILLVLICLFSAGIGIYLLVFKERQPDYFAHPEHFRSVTLLPESIGGGNVFSEQAGEIIGGLLPSEDDVVFLSLPGYQVSFEYSDGRHETILDGVLRPDITTGKVYFISDEEVFLLSDSSRDWFFNLDFVFYFNPSDFTLILTDGDGENAAVPVSSYDFTYPFMSGGRNGSYDIPYPNLTVNSMLTLTLSPEASSYSLSYIQDGQRLSDPPESGYFTCEVTANYDSYGPGRLNLELTYIFGVDLLPPALPVSLVIHNETAAQGELFAVSVLNARPDVEYSILFPHRGEDFPLYESGGTSYIAFVPAGIAMTPGTYIAELRQTEDGVTTTVDSVEYHIIKTSYDRQDLEVSTSLSSLNTSDNANHDAVLVNAAKSNPIAEPLWDSPFILPVDGRITTTFGQERYVNGKFSSRHSGVDIGADEGMPVQAAANGRVVFADELIISGNTVIIDHGCGLFTSYCHLSAFDSSVGDDVKAGSIIGKVGSTGFSTGPHLHYSATIYGIYVNPFYLNGDGLIEGIF